MGVLGGAFNPPHEGHLALARAAHSQLDLERVLLLVTARPPHRSIPSDPGPEVRFELALAAAQTEPWLEASPVELERPGPSYTYASLEQILGAEPDLDAWLVLGGDAAASLPQWERPERVLELAGLAVAGRAGSDIPFAELCRRTEAIPGLEAPPRLCELTMEACSASSTAIRGAVARGEDPGEALPRSVAAQIAQRGLYR